MPFRCLLCVAVLMLLSSATLMAQPQPLPPGQDVPGSISETDPQAFYTYTTEAAETVEITVTALTPGMAPLFFITDPNQLLLRVSGNPQVVSTISETITLSPPGDYTITIGSSNNVYGQFAVRVTSLSAAPDPTPAVALSCPALVENVINLLDSFCQDTARNQACLGHIQVDLALNPAAEPVRFEQQGDIVDLRAVDSLMVSPMDVIRGVWGVVLLRLQANLPDTLPGQNVTMLVFGDVVLENAGGESASASYQATAIGTVNVRSGPGVGYSVLDVLTVGQTVLASGRTAQGDWLRIQHGDQTGWVTAAFVVVSSGRDLLPVVDVSDTAEAAYGPMQAFYFNSGISAAACAEAPDNGILIQTPEGVGMVELLVNEVRISLGSTAYLTASPSQTLTVRTLEGMAVVEALGVTRTAVEGTQVSVPLNEELRPAAPPETPEPLDLEAVRTLPVRTLPRPIILPQPVEGVVLPQLPLTGSCVLATASEIRVNIRSGPGTEFPTRGTGLDPAAIYSVIGRIPDSSWYEIDEGWVAASVTRRGGDCSRVPITYTPLPTAIPATPTPDFLIAGDNEVPNAIIEYGPGLITSYFGQISYPLGDRQDTISYRWGDVPEFFPDGAQFRYSISCSGDGYELAEIVFSDGSVSSCEPTPYNFVQLLSSRTPSGQQQGSDSFTIRLTGGQNAYINWRVTFNWFIP